MLDDVLVVAAPWPVVDILVTDVTLPVNPVLNNPKISPDVMLVFNVEFAHPPALEFAPVVLNL